MTYINQAMRTNSGLTGSFDVSPDLIHAVLGLHDEIFEIQESLDQDNLTHTLEEVGDFCWFLALAGHALGHDPFLAPIPDNLDAMPTLQTSLAFITSAVKKAYAYGAPLPVDALREALDQLAAGTRYSALDMGGLDAILEANIAKLRTRYPDKFTTDHALNRNTDAEMEAVQEYLA